MVADNEADIVALILEAASGSSVTKTAGDHATIILISGLR
jgi:hypothetical protein